MNTNDFYYDLPEDLIAQDPLEDRSSSRLLFLDKKTGDTKEDIFKNIGDYLVEGDVLVRNVTRVIPARLYGIKDDTGARIELLLLKRFEGDRWECLVRPSKKVKVGTRLTFGDASLRAVIEEKMDEGKHFVKFIYDGVFEEVLSMLGEMPLPPYIHHKLEDKERYQTVYAKYDGSAAAPTAGLHFTNDLIEELKSKGVIFADVLLHVGLGTFRPVKAGLVEDHVMHSEYYEISKESADIINLAKSEGRRVICVGTTSCRTVESAADENGVLCEKSGDTDIFIYPGYKFKVMDGLITNFHLPESTLLMLVSAFAGREAVLSAYKQAVDSGFRFFSFGDAMILL